MTFVYASGSPRRIPLSQVSDPSSKFIAALEAEKKLRSSLSTGSGSPATILRSDHLSVRTDTCVDKDGSAEARPVPYTSEELEEMCSGLLEEQYERCAGLDTDQYEEPLPADMFTSGRHVLLNIGEMHITLNIGEMP